MKKVIIVTIAIVALIEAFIIKFLIRDCENKSSLIEILKFIRKSWVTFVVYIIATGIIGLFLGSVFFEKVIGLNELNAWVGIVLGLVALILGIISLFLSFYNVDQANSTQQDTINIIKDFEEKMINRLNLLENSVRSQIEETSEKIKNTMMYKNSESFVNNGTNEVQQDIWGEYQDE